MTERAFKKKKSLFRRILKWTGITFLFLLIAAIILPFIFKSKIIAFAKDEVNKNVNAKVDWGDFDLTFISSFPDFRFSIKDVKVIGVNEFSKDTLLSLPLVQLDMSMMSVLKGGPYKINSVVLDHPRILAKVLANGKANWDISKPSTDTTKATSSEPTKFNLALKKLEIKDGYIVYDDATIPFRSVLDDLTYRLSGDFTQDDFLMKNDMTIGKFTVAYDGMNYLSNVKTEANAEIDMDMKNMKFTFKDNTFKLNELGLGLDGYFAMPGDDYSMDLKFKAKQSEFKNFLSLIPGAYTADFANVQTSGKLAFDGYLKGTYSEKQNTMPGYGVNLQISDASFHYPSVPKSVSAINIDCKVDDADGVPDHTKIDVNKMHADVGGNPFDATLHVSTPVSDAALNGSLKCSVNLATIKDVMPLSKDDQLNGKIDADIKANGRMSQIEKQQYDKFQCSGTVNVTNMNYKSADVPYGVNISSMGMNFTPQFVELSKFDGMLGKNDIHATGRIDNFMAYIFKDSLLRGNFTMNSSLIDLNEFMTPASTTAAATPAPTDTSSLSVIPVPGNIDFTLKSSIAKLIYEKINMDNVSGTVIVRDKTVTMSDLKMNTMGGSMIVNGSYNTADISSPKVKMDLAITDFDIQQTSNAFDIVQKMVPVAKYATGKFSTSFNFSSNLDHTMMPVLNSVNGQGKLSTKQVVINGFGPLKKLDDALKLNKFQHVTLNDITINSFKIADGRVTTDPFDFKVGTAAGQMGGSTGIDQTINYVMNVGIPRTEFGAANSALNSMVSAANAKGVPVNLGDVVNVQALIGGTVTNPTVTTNLKQAGQNLADALKNQIVNTVTQKVDSVKTVVKDDAKKKADQILADAQKKADDLKASEYAAADAAKKVSYDQADQLEKSSNNPLQKIANKKAADAIRKKADDLNTQAKAKADKDAQDIMDKAHQQADAVLK